MLINDCFEINVSKSGS